MPVRRQPCSELVVSPQHWWISRARLVSVKMVSNTGMLPAYSYLETPVHYLLTYDLAHDYLERRGEFRDEHLRRAWEAQQNGELVLAGALDDPADSAVLLFDCKSAEPVLLFAATDPYVINGLVKSFQVRKWNTVVGDLAATPIHPADAGIPLPDAEEEARATAPQTTFSPS
jgi:uncharacterized protein YciI